MDCVILAGGLGTRIRSVSADLPKALIPIGGVPFLEHQLRWLEHCGVTRAILLTGWKSALIEEYVQSRPSRRLEIVVLEDGPRLLGTGGAIRAAVPVLRERFLVTYGDSYLPIPFRDAMEGLAASGRPALMTVLRNQGRYDRSNTRFANGVVLEYDKVSAAASPERFDAIDYGLSAFERSIVEQRIPAGSAYDLAALLHDLANDGQLAALEVTERFYEIGSPTGLRDFDHYVRSAIVM